MSGKALLSAVLAGLLAAPLSAQPRYTDESFQTERGTLPEEAADAMLGRMFGVKGYAPDVQYYVLDFTSHSPGNAAIRSALVPGWGQAFNGNQVKGTLWFSAFALAAVGSAVMANQADKTHDEYEATGRNNGPLYDDYEREYKLSLVLAAAAVGVWAMSVVNAYRQGYDALWSQAPAIDVVYAGDTAGVRWKKRF